MPVTFSDNVQRSTFWQPIEYEWEKGVPYSQRFYFYDHDVQSWKPTSPADALSVPTDMRSRLETITVLSWNIDFSRALNQERMLAALAHLHRYVLAQAEKTPQTPQIVMLNEMTEDTLKLIQQEPWVMEDFHITDINADSWEGGYGTCMLIPKTLTIADVSRIHYTNTQLQRDALFVDIIVDNATELDGKSGIIRLCSTHLESLRAKPPRRPKQLAEAAAYMHRALKPFGAILGGDLNAIQDFDLTLHTDNGLKDAYLETGGVEGAEEGMTWGQMAHTRSRQRYGLCRMDKFLYCGERLDVMGFERFGMDVVVEDQEQADFLREEEGMEKGWVTDHLGIRATFRVGEKAVV